MPQAGDQENTNSRRRMSRLPLIGAMIVIALALLFPLIVTYTHAPELLSCPEDNLVRCAKAWMRELGAGGIVISLILMTLAALTVFPGEAAAMANGVVYGPVWGSLLSWFGGIVGANIAFAAARAIGPHAIGLLLSREQYDQVRTWSQTNGPLALLTARLIPLFPYFAINYAAGLIGMRWWSFNWVSAIGMAPAAIAFTTMGSKAGEMSWLTWLSLAAGLIVLLMLLARIVGHYWSANRPPDVER